ncbi:MAG: NAD(P)/FAD-dependent oxidoreductase [Alphaproteobacteria bacterium]
MVEVVIIGGGVTGSSIAYHLARDGRARRITVVERDPTYEFASTPRSVGGLRRQFSLEENVLMSHYNFEVYRDFEALMAVDGAPAPIDMRRGGYLFLARGEDVRRFEENRRRQRELGVVSVDILDRAEIKARFPSLNLDDIDAGSFGREDGWIDPYAALQGFRRKAKSLGAVYRADEAVGIETVGDRVEAVRLKSGETLIADAVVNAAGAWAAEVAALVGMALPVEPVRRMVHFFEIRETLEPLPLTVDPSGAYFRPEGSGFVAGLSNPDEPAGYNFEVDHDWFETQVWPRLAHRVPAFEALKAGRCWAGLYGLNRLDENLIIGPWSGALENFYVACGFSGHGLQQAPAVGRAVAELILDDRFVSLDLSRLSYRRVVEGTPLRETGIV